MNRDQLDVWCERGILVLVLGILVFGPLATGAVRAPDFLVVQAMTMGVMVLWILRLWLKPRPQFLWPPVCWFVVAFCIYAIGRYWTADIEYRARMEMVRVLVYGFLFLAILNNLHRQEHSLVITRVLVFLAVGITCYAIYQFVTNSDKVWSFTKPYSHRGSGTYISPNNLAGFLEMILPLALAGTLLSRVQVLWKVFTGYAVLVIMVGIAVSLSRGGWIASGLSVSVFFGVLLVRRTHMVPAIVFLAFMGVSALWLLPHTPALNRRWKEFTAQARFNDSARFELWLPALKLWRQDIWWGIGPDHFNDRFRAYRPEIIQLQPDRVHNDYLNTLVDWGLVGAALVASTLAALAAGVVKTWKFVRGNLSDLGSGNSNKFAMVLGASIGLLAILLHSAVEFNMHVPANAIIAITLMSILTGCLRFASGKYWHTLGLWPKALASAPLVAGVVFLGIQGWRRASEYNFLECASRAPTYSAEQIEWLKKAFRTDPMNYETAYEIGESYRIQSWEGADNYAELAAQALDWFGRAARLNPYYSPAFMRQGMCYDWLGKPEQAWNSFEQAILLDPNGYFTAAHVGWHYVQVKDYAAARQWFSRSRRLQPVDNPIAESYMNIVDRKLAELAAD